MVLITLISCRLIDYATINKSELTIIDKIVKMITDMSYEIYLVQYPIIYLLQYININHHLKTPLIIIITILLSYILNMATRKRKKVKKTGIIILVLILILSGFGAYKYVTTKNHEKEMKQLEEELAENAKLMEEKQNEYQQLVKQEEEDWTKELKKLESEANYEELTKALPVTFIGDSVMLGAMNNLHETFPNSYFDSKESRSTYVGYQIISELKENNKLVTKLVNVDRDLVMIPNLAIHMNREANKGYDYNIQKDMLPLYGCGEAKGKFMKQIAEAANVKEDAILASDLFLYNRMKGSIWGACEEFISSPKLDDLQCAFSSLEAFLQSEEPLPSENVQANEQSEDIRKNVQANEQSEDIRKNVINGKSIPVHCVFDNEEV